MLDEGEVGGVVVGLAARQKGDELDVLGKSRIK
jgi:hypothetical protein